MKPMVILTGPTAVGKTELSIRLAKILDAEIISADSMQVYKKMDIGTAKIMPEEMEGIKHYLVDELDPKEEFHVARFQQMAKDALKEIYAKGKIPLIVGGTGFYIQSLLYDIDFTKEDRDQEYRKQLEEKAKREGNDSLYEMLKQVDPKSIEKIHKNNVKRVIRALEFYKLNGYPISEHNEKEAAKTSPYNFAYFVLNHKRDILYDRINRRVDIMAEQGLIDEVKRLKEEGYEVMMTRSDDTYLTLTERAEFANEVEADLFISIHQNSYIDDSTVSGIEVYYNESTKTESDEVLAQFIQTELVETTGARDRGIRAYDELVVTRKTEMPACLVELGYMTNKSELSLLQSDAYQYKLVTGMVNGINQFFES